MSIFVTFHNVFFPPLAEMCSDAYLCKRPLGPKHVAVSLASAYGLVLPEQPADLTAREGDGLGGQSCRVDVTAHQNIHLLFRLHLRLLLVGEGGEEDDSWPLLCAWTGVVLPRRLTSWCILWYTLASLSSTTKDCEGAASPLKMKLRSPRWHFMSVKSMRVVSSLNPERTDSVSTWLSYFQAPKTRVCDLDINSFCCFQKEKPSDSFPQMEQRRL